MNSQLNTLARRYQAPLHKHLRQGLGGNLQAALRLGRQAAAFDLETLDLARIHEQTLIALALPSYSARTREVMVRGSFAVVSAPGQGVTIRARIPFHNRA